VVAVPLRTRRVVVAVGVILVISEPSGGVEVVFSEVCICLRRESRRWSLVGIDEDKGKKHAGSQGVTGRVGSNPHWLNSQRQPSTNHCAPEITGINYILTFH